MVAPDDHRTTRIDEMNTMGDRQIGMGLTALCITLFVGCGGTNDGVTSATETAPRSVILGTWDASLVIDKAKAEEIDQVDLKVARSAKFHFQYRDDGTMRLSVETYIPDMGPLTNEVEGTWELICEDEKTIQLKVHYDSEEDSESWWFVILDEDHIETHSLEDLNGLGILRLARVGR
jgi:hypothetical protein